jgi:hypothetical protein
LACRVEVLQLAADLKEQATSVFPQLSPGLTGLPRVLRDVIYEFAILGSIEVYKSTGISDGTLALGKRYIRKVKSW